MPNVLRSQSRRFLCLRTSLLRAVLGYQTNVLYWLACWIGNIAMVVIGVGYLSYFFPILKDPLVLTLPARRGVVIFVLLNIVGPK